MDIKDRFNQKYRHGRHGFGSEPPEMVEDALEYVEGGNNALDLGTGVGRNALYLLSKGFEVTGVDISEEGINKLKNQIDEESKLNLIVSDVVEFDTDEKFDLVIATGLLHFLNKQDIKKVISNMKKFTKVGGVNVIGTKMQQNYRGDLPHVFEPEELKSYYDDDNWKIIEYKEEARRRPSKIATIIAKKI